jgi:parallel beta-helix repeat protein
MKNTVTLLFALFAILAQAQNFTSGNLVVLRVGDGSTTLAATSAPVSLVEYPISASASATKTLTIPSTGADKLTVAGITTGEGQVSLSQNGLYLCLLGYDQLTGASSLTAGTKVVGRIDNTGTIDLTTKFSTSASGSVRTAFSDNGLSFWTGINNFGYVTLGQTTTPTAINGSAPSRVGAIFNNQLYSLRGFSDLFYTTTAALPTAASTTATALSLSTKLSSNGFVFFDMDNTISWNGTGYDLLYISNSTSGLEKYYYDGTYWKVANSQYNIALTLTSGGSGYTSAPSVTIGPAWVSGTTYAVNDYATNAGNLYIVTTAGTAGTVAPTGTNASIPATGGTAVLSYVAANATATATISGGVVTNIGITAQSGYLMAPSVSITGGGGSGAVATATIGGAFNAFNGTVSAVSFGALAQMTGKIVGGKPTLYAISGSGASTANKIYAITDNTSRTTTMTNANNPSSYITVATAAANYAFRGISFAPSAPSSVITITGTTTAFNTEAGIASAEQSYTVEGTGLSAGITIIAPTGYEISMTSGSSFAASLTLPQTSGTISLTTIYVRLKGTSVGTPSGNITHTSSGAVPQNVAVSGTVVPTTAPVYYYVSPTGSNSNDGLSAATPFQTLSKFSNNTTLIKGGDIIYLMNGTFGTTDLAVGNTGTALMEITRSGSAGKPIKFTNYAGHTPLIQFNGWNAILVKASYIEIDGLKIRGANSVLALADALNQGGSCNNPTGALEGKYNGNGIFVDGRILNGTTVHPTNVVIKNCEVYECGGGGIATTEADYLTIENNKTYNCAWYSIYANSGLSVFHAYNSDNNSTDYKTILRKNISYGNEQKVPWPDASCQYTDGNGLIIDDFRNTQASSTIRGQVYTGKTLVENNLVYNNGGRGVHAYYTDNCTFINNTSYNNNATSSINEGEITIVSSNNCTVFNNILYARTGKKGNSYSGGATGLQSGNNLIFNYTGTLGFGNVSNGDILGTDPKFITNGSNFQLQSTSPAVDAGSTLTGLFPTTDILGSARPYNNVRADIGAYESTFTGSAAAQLSALVSSPNNAICSGEDAVFNFTGTSGATLTYKINGGSNTTIVLTGGAATLTISAATTSQTMTLVSMTDGTTTQTFTNRTSQVAVAPSVGGTISAISDVCAGTNQTPLTLVNHRGIVLRWESSTDNFVTAPTTITSSLTTYYVNNLSATTYYRAVLQNENCPTANSAIMPVIVNPLPTISGILTTTVGTSRTLTGSGTAAASTPWVSATTAVATVSSTGVVMGVSVGTSVVTYTDNNGCAKTATVTVSSAVLPVELIDFKTTPLSKNVRIEWQTASEKNSSHFEIERSENGKDFIKIGSLKAQNTSVLKIKYAFMDEKPQFGINYYRLKMVDNDGQFTYSDIKTASIQTDKTVVKVFPNPTSDAAYLHILSPNEATSIVKLYNTNGQVLRVLSPKLRLGDNNIFVDMTDLPTGLYAVFLEIGDKRFSMKISKN